MKLRKYEKPTKLSTNKDIPLVSKRPVPNLQLNDPVRIHNNSSWRVKKKDSKEINITT